MKEYVEYLESRSHRELILMLARKRAQEMDGAAIVGIGCRFPGGVTDPDRFWQFVREARVVADGNPHLPMNASGEPRWDVSASDLVGLADLLKRGCYLDDIDLFDPERFGISESEAPYVDPQQRLLLTCAAEAMEDASFAPEPDIRVGVFIGSSVVEYNYASLRNRSSLKDLSPHMGIGGALSATAARIAQGLHLRGPALTVDTACSSALTALHLALASLRRNECDAAIVGACHLLLSPFTTAVFERAGMLSRSGRSRPFAPDADGHVRSEGCGVLLLKRARDARADGDRSYAVVIGSSVHRNGTRSDMHIPSSVTHRETISQALRNANVKPLDVQFVEAQANGSRLGALIETEAIMHAYDRKVGKPPLYLGSCKSNFGYMETASGTASLIKTALALNFAEIPRQPEVEVAEKDMPWENSSLIVPTETISWPALTRRIAGISCVGFTGTMGHVLLEASAEKRKPTRIGTTQIKGRSYWQNSNRWGQMPDQV